MQGLLMKWLSTYNRWYDNWCTIAISEPFHSDDKKWRLIYGNARSYQFIECDSVKKAEAEFYAAVNLALTDHGIFHFQYILIPKERAFQIADISSYLNTIQSLQNTRPHKGRLFPDFLFSNE